MIESSLKSGDTGARLNALEAAPKALGDELGSCPLSFARIPWYAGPDVIGLPFDAMSVPLLYRAQLAP